MPAAQSSREDPLDLRQHLRYLIHCAISLKVNNHDEQGTLVNLSMSGCGVEGNESFQVGGLLTVVVHLPDGNPPMEIDLARVRWARGDKFGLQFLRLRPEERERLLRFIDAVDAGATH